MPELQGKIHAKKTWGGLAFRHLVAVATSTIYLKGETKHAPPRPQHPFILHPPIPWHWQAPERGNQRGLCSFRHGIHRGVGKCLAHALHAGEIPEQDRGKGEIIQTN